MNIRSGNTESQTKERTAKPLYRSRLRTIGAPAVMVAVAAVIGAFPEGTSRPGAHNPRVAALAKSITKQTYISDRLYKKSCSLRRSAPNVDQAEINGLRQDRLNPAAVLKVHDRIADPQTTQALDMAAKIEDLPGHDGSTAPTPDEFADGYDFTLAGTYRRAIGRHGAIAEDAYGKLRVLTEGSGVPQLSQTDLFNAWLPLDFHFHPNLDFQRMTTDSSFAAGCQDEYQAEKAILTK